MNLAALKDELVADPAGLGYAALLAAGDHSGAAALLNAKGKTLTRSRVDPAPVRRAIAARWSNLSDQQRSLATFLAVTGFDLDPIDAGDAAIIAELTADKATLLTSAPMSRAEELFGEGTVARHEDVSAALKLGA